MNAQRILDIAAGVSVSAAVFFIAWIVSDFIKMRREKRSRIPAAPVLDSNLQPEEKR